MTIIHDFETLKNCTTLTALDIDTQKTYQFVIHKDRDDSQALINFLRKCRLMVGFNSLDFDYLLTHYLLTQELPKRPDTIARHLYQEAQRVISASNSGEWVRVWEPLIPQMDLFEVWGFSNPSRTVSLKYLAVNMGFHTVLDMPIHHSCEIGIEDVATVLEYNLNDVLVTYELYKRSSARIKLREGLSEKYGIDMMNFPDPKIGESIVLKKLSEKLNQPMSTLKKCRTFRKEVRLKDIILPAVSFKSPEFQGLLKTFQETVVTDTRKSEDVVVTFDNVDYYLGMGGLHACRGNGVYRNIRSSDVSGYYPTLAVAQRFAPAQFGSAFVEVYSEIANERAKYVKGTPESTGLKLAQNGVFGKSNSKFSPFFDPKFFLQITINGQLLLLMLCERIVQMGAGKIILANTDGIEVDVQDEAKFSWICECWEKKFGLKLEHSTYRLLSCRDINNYIGIPDSGKVKLKGVFKTNEELVKDEELHKDFSQDIVKEAVLQYFLKGTPIESTINSCTDLTKFLIADRAKVGEFVLKELRNGELINEPLPRTIRYYISRGGGSLYKTGTKGHDSQVQKGYQITLMNTLGEFRFINHKYYIKAAWELLESITSR